MTVAEASVLGILTCKTVKGLTRHDEALHDYLLCYWCTSSQDIVTRSPESIFYHFGNYGLDYIPQPEQEACDIFGWVDKRSRGMFKKHTVEWSFRPRESTSDLGEPAALEKMSKIYKWCLVQKNF